jgi:hypothetical protein
MQEKGVKSPTIVQIYTHMGHSRESGNLQNEAALKDIPIPRKRESPKRGGIERYPHSEDGYL